MITKNDIIEQLKNGICPDELQPFDIGQGMGYKNFDTTFADMNENYIIYIPEYGYNNSGVPDLDSIYTKGDFISLCNNDIDKAEYLFESVDWQYPESLLNEMESFV